MPAARTCAVLVTYHPKTPVDALLSALLAQVDCVCVVDNGSGSDVQHALQAAATASAGRITCIANADNLGLAAAQNQGIRYALAHGYDWVLLLDADSLPEPKMVQHMLNAWNHMNDPHIGIIAPRIAEQNVELPSRHPAPSGRFSITRKLLHSGEYITDALTVIASGSLLHKEVFHKAGLMIEDYFIDYIDHEFCLRARKSGYTILLVGDAVLQHRQGHKTAHRMLGVSIATANYSPLRRYYIFRNRMFFLRAHARQFQQLWTYELLAYVWDVARILLVETNRSAKLRGALKGLFAGITTSAIPTSGNTGTPISQ
jgi:rhamnosyltransferase